MQGTTGFRKTVNKAMWWWKHGTHSLDPGQLARLQRERIQRYREPMYATIREAMDAARRKP